MSVDREPVWAALLARLQAKFAAFAVVSRKHTMPPKLTIDLQPAMFLIQAMEDTKASYGPNGSKILHGFLMIYDYDTNPEEPIGGETAFMATRLNGYLKAVDDALAADPGFDAQNLGLPNVVEHCWIDGASSMDQGIIGNQAFIQIPLHISVFA